MSPELQQKIIDQLKKACVHIEKNRHEMALRQVREAYQKLRGGLRRSVAPFIGLHIGETRYVPVEDVPNVRTKAWRTSKRLGHRYQVVRSKQREGFYILRRVR